MLDRMNAAGRREGSVFSTVRVLICLTEMLVISACSAGNQPEFEPIEEELRKHDPGWWDRVVHAIPELSSLGGTPQPKRYHAEGDVAQHTRLAVESCPSDCDNDLLWAVLLHDAGKPSVTKEKGGKITAHGHHKAGA